MKIEIRTIDHKAQRYNTAGDYFEGKEGFTFFRISEMGNEDYNFLIAIHEFGEAYLCKREGIKFKDIDKFDIDHPELDDPGSSPKAPYHKQHMLMLIIEKLLCRSMGLSWKMYEKRLAEVCV